MKRSRKGFTLVELLIIVAIIGALAATMMMSTGSSIAKSKATAIANNLRICTAGAQAYYLEHESDTTPLIGAVKCTDMLTAAVPNFASFNGNNIAYAATGDAGPTSWIITVTLTGTDKADILKAMKTIQGFTAVDDEQNSVVYTVFTGAVAAGR